MTLANPFPPGARGHRRKRGARQDVVETRYAGSRGLHLGREYDLNQAFARPAPWLNAINYMANGSNSYYNAAQITLRKRGAGKLFYRIGYSFSKSVDDASQFSGVATGGFSGAQDSRNLRLERGRSDWDRTHALQGSASWHVPVGKGSALLGTSGGIANAILGGWQLSSSFSGYSGSPFTVTVANADLNVGEFQRPNRIGTGIEPDRGSGHKGVDYPFFRAADFEPVPCARDNCAPSRFGFQPFAPGNSGRNILSGPRLFVVNGAMLKNFQVRESQRVQFRFEAFNVPNRPNFLLPNRQLGTFGTGQITGVLGAGRGGPRSLQLALRYEF